MRDTDLLLLKFDEAGAPGLKPGRAMAPEEARGRTLVTPDGIAHYKHLTMQTLARLLERSLETPVVDATGLGGEFEINWPKSTGYSPGEKLESARDTLKSFDLKLVPDKQLHEVFIVEKVK